MTCNVVWGDDVVWGDHKMKIIYPRKLTSYRLFDNQLPTFDAKLKHDISALCMLFHLGGFVKTSGLFYLQSDSYLCVKNDKFKSNYPSRSKNKQYVWNCNITRQNKKSANDFTNKT